MSDVLVDISGVSKKFCKRLRRSLWYGLRDLGSEVTGQPGVRDRLRKDEFWALQDVTVSVRRGEMLALIGQNGSGKSTLLKMISGLIRPDKGAITTRGRVQALIELGSGFNPVLSGRENIYVNASVLGIPRRRVDEIFPDIIAFAELNDFIDAPVQSYSSGMKARLGFAISAQLDPDVLLIDEVLAVGDMAFQEKCMRRMDALRGSDKALVFVTHSLYQVEALCDTALWLDAGKVVRYGAAHDVVREYLDDQERRAMAESMSEGVAYEGRATTATRAYLDARDHEDQAETKVPTPPATRDLIDVHRVELLDGDRRSRSEFPFRSDLLVRVHYHAHSRVEHPLFNLRFINKGRGVFETSMLIDGSGPEWVEGEGVVECRIPALPLTPKLYEILLFVRSAEGIANLTTMRTVAHFRVTDEGLEVLGARGPMAINHLRQGSPVYVGHEWRFRPSNGSSAPAGASLEAPGPDLGADAEGGSSFPPGAATPS